MNEDATNNSAEYWAPFPPPIVDQLTGQRAAYFFGYAGRCCETAINNDNVEWAKECVRRGWMNKDTVNLPGESMVVMAERRDRTQVAKYFRSLGWQ